MASPRPPRARIPTPRCGLTPTPLGIPQSRHWATRPTCFHHHERVGRKSALRAPAALRREGRGGASASASGSWCARESAQSLAGSHPRWCTSVSGGSGRGGAWGLGRRVRGRDAAVPVVPRDRSVVTLAGRRPPASARAARGANGRPGGVLQLPGRRPGPGNGPRGSSRVRTLLRCRG